MIADAPGSRTTPQDRQAEVSLNAEVVELASSVSTKCAVSELPTAKARKTPASKGKVSSNVVNHHSEEVIELDLTTLSRSALQRRITKPVLVAFLESKGVNTVGDDGKTLKKADLVEAVCSLV